MFISAPYLNMARLFKGRSRHSERGRERNKAFRSLIHALLCGILFVQCFLILSLILLKPYFKHFISFNLRFIYLHRDAFYTFVLVVLFCVVLLVILLEKYHCPGFFTDCLPNCIFCHTHQLSPHKCSCLPPGSACQSES